MIKNIEIKDEVWVKACEKYGLEKLKKSIGLTVQTLIKANNAQYELIEDYGSDVAIKINGYAISIYENMQDEEDFDDWISSWI